MGSAKFWVEQVMMKLIPTMVGNHKVMVAHKNLINGKRDPSPHTSKASVHLPFSMEGDKSPDPSGAYILPCAFDTEEHHQDFLTNDVVYTLDHLCSAFRVDKPASRDTARDELMTRWGVTQISGFPQSVDYVASLFRSYRVWNARKQEWQTKYGICNNDVLELFGIPEIRRAWMLMAFEIQHYRTIFRPDQETQYTDLERNTLRGHFHPYFYPGCYALKDDLYESYPCVLKHLRDHVLAEVCPLCFILQSLSSLS